MGRGLAAAFVILIIDCGGGGQSSPTDASTDAGDVGSKFDASWVVDGGDTDAGADVVPLEAGPPCVEGDFYLDMTNDAGTTTLTSGCGDAGAPSIAFDMDCLDCQSVGFSACGGGRVDQGEPAHRESESARSAGTEIDRTDSDGGICQFNGDPDDLQLGRRGRHRAGRVRRRIGPARVRRTRRPISGHFCLQRQ